MYGIVDAGYQSTSLQNTDAKNDTNVSAIGASAQSSSRLGVKGVEDIGAGMKADFVVELGLKVTDPSVSGSTNDVNNSAFDNRQTNVGLTGSFGSVRLGRQYSATHGVIAASDAGGGNNMIGGTTYVAGNSTADFALTPFYGNSAYVVRASNALSYTSPSMNGLVVGFGVSQKNKTADAVATDGNARSVAAGYTNGPLMLGASYTKHTASLTQPATAVSGGLTGLMVASTAYFVQQKETALGGTYDMGKAKLFANYLKTEADGTKATTDFANAVKRTAYEIGLKAPVTAKVNVWAKYGKGKTNLTNSADIATGTADSFAFSAQQVGAEYAFSKRTNAYGIYGHAKADKTATTDARGNAYAVGIRHMF
jgi:predicted porin